MTTLAQLIRLGVRPKQVVPPPEPLVIPFGAETNRGEGSASLGYAGAGTLVLTDPSGLFAINSVNRLVIAGTYGAAPPALAGPYPMTVSDGEGWSVDVEVTIQPNRRHVMSRSTDVQSSNEIRTALLSSIGGGKEIVLRPDAEFNPSRNGTGLGGTWTVRLPVNAGITAAMTGDPTDIPDSAWIKVTCDTHLGAIHHGLEIEGTNRHKAGVWFHNILFRHLYSGTNLSDSLLQLGRGNISSYISYVRVSECSFNSNNTDTGQLAGTAVLNGVGGATGSRAIWIHDCLMDGLYDGVQITGNLGSSGHETEPSNIYVIGCVWSRIWNDCRKFLECAPIYSEWHLCFDKKYGTGGLHGDMEQRVYDLALPGTYQWGTFRCNRDVRGVGTVGWQGGQGLFQTCGAAGVSLTGAIIEGYLYAETFQNAIILKNCVGPSISYCSVIQDQTSGITSTTPPQNCRIRLDACSDVIVKRNAMFATIFAENGTTFADNSENVVVGVAGYAAAYLSATTIGASQRTVAGQDAAFGMKIGGTLDKAVTGYAAHVGALGTGYIDFNNRTTSFPALN